MATVTRKKSDHGIACFWDAFPKRHTRLLIDLRGAGLLAAEIQWENSEGGHCRKVSLDDPAARTGPGWTPCQPRITLPPSGSPRNPVRAPAASGVVSDGDGSTRSSGGVLTAIVQTVVWTAYVLKSKRVAATFTK